MWQAIVIGISIPQIDTQADFARHAYDRAAMKQKCVFVIGLVFAAALMEPLRVERMNVPETDSESGSTDGIQLLLSSHKVNRALHVLDAFMGFECHGRR